MYKTAVHLQVDGGVTHQKQQISEEVISRSITLPMSVNVLQSNISPKLMFAV